MRIKNLAKSGWFIMRIIFVLLQRRSKHTLLRLASLTRSEKDGAHLSQAWSCRAASNCYGVFHYTINQANFFDARARNQLYRKRRFKGTRIIRRIRGDVYIYIIKRPRVVVVVGRHNAKRVPLRQLAIFDAEYPSEASVAPTIFSPFLFAHASSRYLLSLYLRRRRLPIVAPDDKLQTCAQPCIYTFSR